MSHREAFAGKMVTAAKGKGYLGGGLSFLQLLVNHPVVPYPV